ncbi:MAG: hypothetical protein Q8T11_17060 [Elusimicrobiota bacterium]|nr:hypothetical protein [Elusimicrobiota bacterium]
MRDTLYPYFQISSRIAAYLERAGSGRQTAGLTGWDDDDRVSLLLTRMPVEICVDFLADKQRKSALTGMELLERNAYFREIKMEWRCGRTESSIELRKL